MSGARAKMMQGATSTVPEVSARRLSIMLAHDSSRDIFSIFRNALGGLCVNSGVRARCMASSSKMVKVSWKSSAVVVVVERNPE